MQFTEIKMRYWLFVLGNRSGFSTRTLDEKSEELLRELWDVVSQLKPIYEGSSKRKYWICLPPAEYEEYKEYFDEEEYSDEELKEMYEQEYREENWYEIVLHAQDEYIGAFINKEYVLSVCDPNESGWPMDAAELISLLIEKAKETVSAVEEGTYNDYIKENLPDEYKYGRIKRKDYYDINPQARKDYRGRFKKGEIEEFLSLVSSPDEEGHMGHMTVRDFYEACAVGYKAAGYEMRSHWRFEDSEEERERYKDEYLGTTPKEMYYMFADGRDDNLIAVPLDDEYEFSQWLERKGKYEMTGHHPWEIRGSFSLHYSIHLFVKTDGRGKYFVLSGKAFSTSVETIKMYIAIRKAGYPVVLEDKEIIAARLLETDDIGVLPMTISPFGARYGDSTIGYDVQDFVNLYDSEHPEEVSAKTRWIEEPVLELIES